MILTKALVRKKGLTFSCMLHLTKSDVSILRVVSSFRVYLIVSVESVIYWILYQATSSVIYPAPFISSMVEYLFKRPRTNNPPPRAHPPTWPILLTSHKASHLSHTHPSHLTHIPHTSPASFSALFLSTWPVHLVHVIVQKKNIHLWCSVLNPGWTTHTNICYGTDFWNPSPVSLSPFPHPSHLTHIPLTSPTSLSPHPHPSHLTHILSPCPHSSHLFHIFLTSPASSHSHPWFACLPTSSSPACVPHPSHIHVSPASLQLMLPWCTSTTSCCSCQLLSLSYCRKCFRCLQQQDIISCGTCLSY